MALNQALSNFRDAITPPPPIPAYLGAFINGAFQKVVATNPALAYVRYLDDTPTTAKHRNRVDLSTSDQNVPIGLYYDELGELAIFDLSAAQAGAVLQTNPNAGTPYKPIYSVATTSDPPTAAELTTAFGAPALIAAGKLWLLNNGGAGVHEYLVTHDGANWLYQELTQAV